ncbi:TPA: transcriptional regulator [Escherichia coli]|nr:transcriptional regulator [Escherichia coli]EGY0364154.1 transcriptional regulator [Escherichia coli]HBU8060276.1 transcriptional regulator [Escherichia coli]
MYWIINDNIEFWPEHRKLISVHNADLNVVLTTPASRCLSLLLEAFPDVVAQQDFFTRVWEEEGMRVPTNTLYQNISIIRRGFRAVGDTTHSLIATVPRRGFKIHNDINIQNHVINSSTDAHTHNAPPAIKVNAGYKESIGGAKNFNNKILKHIKSYLIMLSAFVIGAYSAYWLWNNNQPKPFFKDYKTVAEINSCHFNVTEDTIDGLKEFDKYKTRILDSGINCKKYPWLYFPLAKSSPGMIVMACNKNYNQHEVAGCLTLSYREVNRD